MRIEWSDWRIPGTTLLVACAVAIVGMSGSSAAPEPDDLVDEAMDYLGFDDSHRNAVLGGEVLFTGMPGLEPLPEAVAVAGAMMLIRRPWEEMVEVYMKEDPFRSDPHLLDTGRIEGDSVAWKKGVAFSGAERKELQKMIGVKPGGTFNLDASEIGKFAALPRGTAGEEQAMTLFVDLLAKRARDYRARGLAGIRPYARGGGRQASPGDELTAAIKDSEFLRRHFPQLHDVLLRYPEGKQALASSRYYWTKKEVSGRPTIALLHKTLWIGETASVAVEREFYVGQGYNSMFTIVAAVPYEGGTLMVAANRTFTERVTGMGRSLKKTMGRKVVAAKFAERFEHLRAAFEQNSR